MRVSVIVPAYNAAEQLRECLTALERSQYVAAECIVVDDGSTDDTALVATSAGAIAVSTDGRSGPATARNLGARLATGDLLVFIDADVAVHADTLSRIVERFENDKTLDALAGSYDDAPAHPGFVSQFKNLMHSFIHHEGNRQASTFWCACGAVKRSVFLEHGGLDESYREPSIEDIELGFRMVSAARKIAMDPTVQCKHLKAWTFRNLIRTDVLLRGVPWTRLILRTGALPDDLNLRKGQRAAALLSAIFLSLSLLIPFQAAVGRVFLSWRLAIPAVVACLAGVLLINRAFYRFLALRKGWGFSFSAIPMHVLYYIYSSISFVLGVGIHALDRRADRRAERSVTEPKGAGTLAVRP